MFRIHFEPKGGFWCVQFERMGFFWVTVRVPSEAPPAPNNKGKPALEVLRFKSYEEAEAYVREKGLDFIYRCRSGEPPSVVFQEPYPAQKMRFSPQDLRKYPDGGLVPR